MTVSQPRLLTAAIATTVFVLISPALSLAQEVRLPPDTELALEEIIVTAQKRSTSVQETPIAITAFTGEILANGVVTDAADLNGRVPNLHIAKAGSNVEIAIRGINSTNNVEAGDPAVAFHVDGIYLGRPIAAGAIFYDLERVEVLNGPQGTLYGRNATAGSINVITNKPEEEFSASLELNAGNYDRVYTQGMVLPRLWVRKKCTIHSFATKFSNRYVFISNYTSLSPPRLFSDFALPEINFIFFL